MNVLAPHVVNDEAKVVPLSFDEQVYVSLREFEISEEKIVEQLKGQVAEFQQKNPGVEFWEAVRSMTGLSKASPAATVRMAYSNSSLLAFFNR